MDKVKEFYAYPWQDSFEAYLKQFYNKSLNYKQPREMLKLAADILSEGSDFLYGNLVIAWKKVGKISISGFTTKLKELMGDKWTEKLQEKGSIFLSISKIKKRLMIGRGLVNDWSNQAKDAAINTSSLLLAGGDELYFWSLSTFKNYSEYYNNLVLPIKNNAGY